MPKIIVIIESSDISANYMAQAVKDLGFSVLFLCQLKDYQGDTREQILSHPHHDIDTSNAQTIINFLRNNKIEVAGVLTLLDSFLHVSCEVANFLNCPGIDRSVLSLKDKAFVVDLIPEFSPKSLSFNRLENNFERLNRFMIECEKEIILKPRFAAGAVGFCVVNEAAQLDQVLNSLSRVQLPERLSPNLWIAQEKLEGQVISCEGFVTKGIVFLLGFTGTTKYGNTQSKCYFPFDASISIAAQLIAKSAINELVNRSSFKNGYFHIEFIISGEKATLIDANMGRLGGGAVGEQLALSAGLHPIKIFSHFISTTILEKQSLSLDQKMMKYDTKAYLYGLEKQGSLESLKIGDIGACYHTRIIDDGRDIASMGENNWSWVGILSGRSNEIDDAFSNIQVRSNGAWGKAIC